LEPDLDPEADGLADPDGLREGDSDELPLQEADLEPDLDPEALPLADPDVEPLADPDPDGLREVEELADSLAEGD
jgi:hypothetical protein